MAPLPANIVHLPNGQNLTVSPVFGGLFFNANDLHSAHSRFPPGLTLDLNSEDELDMQGEEDGQDAEPKLSSRHTHRFKRPTLHSDHLYISSISNPSNIDFKPATSPTRQVAMMLWATLSWYFHQVQPFVQFNLVKGLHQHQA